MYQKIIFFLALNGTLLPFFVILHAKSGIPMLFGKILTVDGKMALFLDTFNRRLCI